MDRSMIVGRNALGLVVRLALLSVVVGIVLMTIGITPENLFSSIDRLVRRIYDLGFGAIEWVGRPLILGAMVVVPIWLVARLFGFGRGGPGGPDGAGRNMR